MAFDNAGEAAIGYEQMRRCLSCQHHEKVMGDIFLGCRNQDWEMRGQNRAIKEGLWFYPWMFDPLWAATLCKHWLPPAAVAEVIPMRVAA